MTHPRDLRLSRETTSRSTPLPEPAAGSRILPDSTEAVGYSTDDEEHEQSHATTPQPPSRKQEAAAAMCSVGGGAAAAVATASDENRPTQRSAMHSEREEGAAEALVLAGCPSSAQMPLMLLLSAGQSR